MAEEMSTSRSESLSQGDYIVKTAYGSVDVSSGDFNKKVNEFKNLIDKYEGYITNTYLSTNYQGLKSYNLTSSIPAESFDEFLIAVEEVSKLRYINQDIEILEDQKNYYETSVSYSTLSLEIREGSGISLFSWNYYVQRALGWIEGLVGITISLSIVLVPLGILIIGYRRFKTNK